MHSSILLDLFCLFVLSCQLFFHIELATAADFAAVSSSNSRSSNNNRNKSLVISTPRQRQYQHQHHADHVPDFEFSDEAKTVAFWNVYAAGSHFEDIIKEQLLVIESSGLMDRLDTLYYSTIGVNGSSYRIPGAKLKHLHYFGSREDESRTLSLLARYCRKNLKSKVLYFHNKGSFNYHIANTNFRKALDCWVLNPHCLEALDTHDVCGWRISPMPHLHFSGNYWWATCAHIDKLIPPLAPLRNQTFLQVTAAINPGRQHSEDFAFHDYPNLGFGRFFAETWVGTLPTFKAADCMGAAISSTYIGGYLLPITPDICPNWREEEFLPMLSAFTMPGGSSGSSSVGAPILIYANNDSSSSGGGGAARPIPGQAVGVPVPRLSYGQPCGASEMLNQPQAFRNQHTAQRVRFFRKYVPQLVRRSLLWYGQLPQLQLNWLREYYSKDMIALSQIEQAVLEATLAHQQQLKLLVQLKKHSERQLLDGNDNPTEHSWLTPDSRIINSNAMDARRGLQQDTALPAANPAHLRQPHHPQHRQHNSKHPHPDPHRPKLASQSTANNFDPLENAPDFEFSNESRVVGFWNVFAQGAHYQDINKEQLFVMESSGLLERLDTLYYATIGAEGATYRIPGPKMKHLHYFGPRADEIHTLSLLARYCRKNPNSKVLYFHNKGSLNFHSTNTNFRKALDCFVLNPKCLDTLDSHDVCGWRVAAVPHIHLSGNYWWATCTHVNKLIPPLAPLKNETFLQTTAAINPRRRGANDFSFHDYPNLGLGRFFAETWVGTLPDYKAADCVSHEHNKNYVGGYRLPWGMVNKYCPSWTEEFAGLVRNYTVSDMTGTAASKAPRLQYGLPCGPSSILNEPGLFRDSILEQVRSYEKYIPSLVQRSLAWYGQKPVLQLRWLRAILLGSLEGGAGDGAKVGASPLDDAVKAELQMFER